MAKDRLFSFNTPEFPTYNFEVVSFNGYQEIGELYRYEIDLVSKDKDVDFDKILSTEVSLVLHNKNSDDIYVHGVLEHFEAHQMIDDFIHYKAYLVPKLWWLTLAQHQEIFLDKKVPDIIESVLKEAKFTSNDYEFRLQGSYNKREYVCQYKESRYDFIKRWMHREGIYFYFEANEDGSKIIFSDKKDIQKKLSNMDEMLYKPDSGLQSYEQQAVSSIIYRSNNTLKSVRMKNYNYEKPSLEINSVTDSSAPEYAQSYLFGNNIKSQEEAKKLSEINTQKYKCLDKEMIGESNIIYLVVGNIYRLKDYFREDLNDDYLMVRVECEGSQRGFLTTSFNAKKDNSSYYKNNFVMIPAKTQYRMQTTPQWPQISGTISAKIDAQGSGDTAQLDKHGRYKVIMPFDLSGRSDAKASTYLRMAQPSAGEQQGIHFPLHKGTEVLVSFKGGDPDQPVIMGAVPNVNTPSPVNENNVTKNIIQTHGGNIIHMEDTPGKAHIKMAVHDNLSSITIHNQDDENADDKTLAQEIFGLKFETEGGSRTFTRGNVIDITLGAKEEFLGLGLLDVKLAEVVEVFVGYKQEVGASDLYELITGTRRGSSPLEQKLTEVTQQVINNDNRVINNDNRVINNITQTIREEVTITEDMISEMVKGIVTGMNLTETLERKISVLENKVVTADNFEGLFKEYITTVENSIGEFESDIKQVNLSIQEMTTVISKAKTHMKKSELKVYMDNIVTHQAKITIYN